VVVMDALSKNVAATFSDDADSDGLLNTDETALGTNPRSKDSDADGMDDSPELIAGTSPTNSASILSVTCTFLSNGQKRLSWFGVQGRAYTFQYSDSLKAEWQSYPFEVPGSDFTIAFLDTATLSNRFYRVKVRIAD
jgi:hypothetical protein